MLYTIFTVNSILPLINTPYLARTLGPSSFGLLAFFQSMANIIIIVIEFGFGFSATRALTREGHQPVFRSQALQQVFTAKLLIAIAVIVSSLFVLGRVPVLQKHPLLLGCALASGVLGGFNLNWYFQGIGRLTLQAMIETSARMMAVALIFSFVRSKEDAGLVLAINSTAALFSLSSGLIVASRDTRLPALNFQGGLDAIKTSWPLFLYRAAMSICTAGNGIILGFFSSQVSVAYYAGAEKIIRGLTSISQPLSQLLYANVNKSMNLGIFEAKKMLKRGASILIPCTLSMSVFVFAFSHKIIAIFLGDKFEPSVHVIRVLAILPTIAAITLLLGVQWMVPLGLERMFTKIMVYTSLLNAVLAALLAVKFGEIGVSWAVVISELFAVVLCSIALTNQNLHPLWFKTQLTASNRNAP